ncbi:transporter [Patiriisocius sp. Uisw_017]|jgi:hypothetical protein|uniref:transporter n=1 Tax=Patiriisocius sp. Uisw_017 TaxID=3230968 RepID=UPI0039ED92CD
MRTKYILLILALLSIKNASSQISIDGFFKAKGDGALVLGAGFEDTKNYFSGSTRTDISRSLYYGNLFGSYGITDALDVNISIPFLSSNENSNFQDIALLLKYRIFKRALSEGELSFGGVLGFSTPLTDYDIGGLNDIGQQATTIGAKLLAHYQNNYGWFSTLQVGYYYKLEEVPNAIPVGLKMGKATSNLYFDVFYEYQNSEMGIDYLGTPSPQNFRELEVDFHKLGGTFYKPFSSKWGAYLAVSYVVVGRNVFQGPGYGLGLVYNFKR